MNNPLINIHKAAGARLVEKNGITVPLVYGSPGEEYGALRSTVAILDYSHYLKMVVGGADAFELMDRIITARLGEARDESAIYSLILDEAGDIVTDCYVLNNEDEFIVLAEHIDDRRFLGLLESKGGRGEVTFTTMADSHSLIVCEGPYSWELVKECFGMDIIGIPHLGFMTTDDDVIVFRCGKNGEFCYKLLVPFSRTEGVWDLLTQKGAAFHARKVGLSLQDITRLENPFWNPSILADYTKNPIELQLQWTIRYDKDDFCGLKSLRVMMSWGSTHRVVGARLTGSEETSSKVGRGDRLYYRDNVIGQVINIGYSPFPTRPGHIALLRLLAEYAYAGIDSYEVKTADDNMVPLATCSTPFIVTRSFLIDPHVHSYIDGNKPKDYAEKRVSEQ